MKTMRNSTAVIEKGKNHAGGVTERFYQLLEQRSKASGKSVEQLKREATAKDGLRRLGKPADIAALALFLCSEKAQHIQGTAIAVDGGSTVGYY
jgi:3-oxoacyl-[acyl-carrier protein] reductase